MLNCIKGDGDLWIRGSMSHDAEVQIDKKSRSLKEGDEAIITYNIDEAKIYMRRNDELEGMIFQNIETGKDIEYKFAFGVMSPKPGTSVTIIDVEDLTYHGL